MPLTKPPPMLDSSSTSRPRSKTKTRPKTASGRLTSSPYSFTDESPVFPNGRPKTGYAAPSPSPSHSPPRKAESFWANRFSRQRPHTDEGKGWTDGGADRGIPGMGERERWNGSLGGLDGGRTKRQREVFVYGDGNILERTTTPEDDRREISDGSGKENGLIGGRTAGGLMPPRDMRAGRESGLWEIGQRKSMDNQERGSGNATPTTQGEGAENVVPAEEEERGEYTPLTTPGIGDKLDFMDEISFSNRGSVLLSGKKALEVRKQRKAIIRRENARNMAEVDTELGPEGDVASERRRQEGSESQYTRTTSESAPTTEIEFIPDTMTTSMEVQTELKRESAPETSEAPRESTDMPPRPPQEPPTMRTEPAPVPPVQAAETESERSSSSPTPSTPKKRPYSEPSPSSSQKPNPIEANRTPLELPAKPLPEPEPVLINLLQARPRMPSQRHTMPKTPSITTLSQEIEAESLKVRSMYEAGTADAIDWRNGSLCPPADAYTPTLSPKPSDVSFDTKSTARRRPHTAHPDGGKKRESVLRRENELAGGIEDWDGIQSASVDRYGFIVEPPSPVGPEDVPREGGPRPPQRVTTVLQLAAQEPRQGGLFGRRSSMSRSVSRSGRSTYGPGPRSSSRSLRTQATSDTNHRSPGRTSRAIINRLPGMGERRLMDEAGDMLTLPPGLSSQPEDKQNPAVIEAKRRQEARRAEKWRHMAKVVRPKSPIKRSKSTSAIGKGDGASAPVLAASVPSAGGGMNFTFDISDPKLISRVWKGVPDRWRATAWHSFLLSSAKRVHPTTYATDAELHIAFLELVDCSSADDVQIDVDVPRTINSHIMFRSRYRGGQRLLFRVLHCLSLYFLETGYVQGMASLCATLLCYFDEEGSFVMAVRMWEYRGLKRLFAPGFGGLMSALDEFRVDWLRKGNRDISDQLDEMGIHPTAYGTRWYLTLFNYSVPFETQLRIWDIFMLLGDETPALKSMATKSATSTNRGEQHGKSENGEAGEEEEKRPFHGQLDVLHAAGCAIVDGTREVLLGAEFENVMKVLTSWVPVRDEEVFIKVLRAEWRRHGRK